jgi:hypothetical protein
MPGIIGRSLSELPAELRHPVVHADDLIAVPTATTGGPAHSLDVKTLDAARHPASEGAQP